MNNKRLTALFLSAVFSVVSLGLHGFAADQKVIEAEADGVSAYEIKTSESDNNSKIIKTASAVTYYINVNQTPRATIFKLSDISSGEKALAKINFDTLFVNGDSSQMEYCLFVSGNEIALDTSVQEDVKEELLSHVSEDDIITKTVNDKNELVWDIPAVTADKDGYVYLYIGCGNINQDGKVADYKRQWVIDSFDVGIYGADEEIPSEMPTQAPTAVPTAAPTEDTGATEAPTLTPTEPPEPVEGFDIDYVYSDNMVFQRGQDIVITGTGKSGETLTATLNGNSAQTVIEHGTWEITLPAMGVLKSGELVITDGEESVTLRNVAVGDVILCTGQSNMDNTFNSWGGLKKSELDKDYEDMRLMIADDTSGWKVATVENSTGFSALGYMIGKRLLTQNPDVPVGLVKASLGGSAITQWVPNYAVNWNAQAKRMMAGVNSKGGLYTQKILPVSNLKYSAAVWYQGEANTSFDKGTVYEEMLISLIDNWRTTLEDPDLPFVIIQLPTANFARIYSPERIGTGVRAAQWNVSERMDNVDTVVSIDTGSTNNVHPADKQPIADRTAAFINDYIHGTKSDIESPSFDHMQKNGDVLTLFFKNTYGALMTDDSQAPLGFELKGADGVYKEAVPVINGDTLVFDVSGIEDPQVRYAWSDTPGIDKQLVIDQIDTPAAVNTYNAAGRPLAPFKTDETEKYAYKDLSLMTDCYSYAPYVLKTEQEGKDVVISAYDTDGVVEKVEVYVDEELAGEAVKDGDKWRFTPDVEPGVHTVYAIATDNDGYKNTECVDYPNYNLTRPARYDFVSEDYSVSDKKTEYKNGDELIENCETNADGTDLKAESAIPYGETTTSAKLEVTPAGKTVSMSVPVSEGKDPQKKITIEYDTKFEKADNDVRAARGMYAVTKTGKELQLVYFTKTSMRVAVYGMFYETAMDIKEDTWHHIKMEIYPNRGTFSIWLDGVMRYDDVSFINEAKDFDKNKGGFDVLKEGITELKFYHTSANDNNGIKNATYIDNVVFDEETFTNSTDVPTEEATATPTVEPTEEATATPTVEPTEEATATPTEEATAIPTVAPTEEATATPTIEPTEEATAPPTDAPTDAPSDVPTAPPTPVTDYIITDILADGDITVTVQLPDEENEDAVLYIAVYNSDGNLIGLKSVDNVESTNTIAMPEASDKVKAFIWNDNMSPLCDTKYINVNN